MATLARYLPSHLSRSLVRRARLLRYRGEYAEALRVIQHAQDLIGESHAYWMMGAVTEEGHIRLALGQSGAASLRRACDLAGWTPGEREKELELSGLHRAQSRFESKQGLVCGESLEHMRPGVRGWLRRTGRLGEAES